MTLAQRDLRTPRRRRDAAHVAGQEPMQLVEGDETGDGRRVVGRDERVAVEDGAFAVADGIEPARDPGIFEGEDEAIEPVAALHGPKAVQARR
jgi:hypothetical protein